MSSYDPDSVPELPGLFDFSSRIQPSVINLIAMFRQITARPLLTANRALAQRSFSVAVPRLGEGDTGAPRSGAGGSSGYVSPSSPWIACASSSNWAMPTIAKAQHFHLTAPP